MTDGTTVVLGWDGLDYELAKQFGLADAFGRHNKRIETFDNPALGKPHTHELWPSIITGVEPEDHGVWAKTEGTADWDSPVIQTVANVAENVIPDRLRTKLGAMLRARGAEMSHRGPDYYRDVGVDTVFDGRQALPLGVPNYHTATNDRYGILADRGAQLAEYLDFDTSGTEGEGSWYEPGIPDHEFEQLIAGEASQKLGIVRAAVQREYDLVFVWLGYLDTVGHLAPVVDEAGFRRRAYDRSATWTREVADTLQPEDTLVCVSDHGLRNGFHTHDAFLGTSEERAIDGVRSVLGVRDGIERVTPASGEVEDPPIREAHQHDDAGETREAAAVRDQLENLGYV